LGEIKKLIMKKNLLIVGLFLTSQMFAQTGIGTTTPHASAKLDVNSNNKGFLPPRIALTGVYDVSTIPAPATGLLVYCTGTGGLASGYYFFNGTAWATIATEGGSGSFAASYLRGSRIATQTIAVGGIVIFSNIDNSSGGDISLPKLPFKEVRVSRWSTQKVPNPIRDLFKFKKFTRKERKYILSLFYQI
jgi:hypothetical protein